MYRRRIDGNQCTRCAADDAAPLCLACRAKAAERKRKQRSVLKQIVTKLSAIGTIVRVKETFDIGKLKNVYLVPKQYNYDDDDDS